MVRRDNWLIGPGENQGGIWQCYEEMRARDQVLESTKGARWHPVGRVENSGSQNLSELHELDIRSALR